MEHGLHRLDTDFSYREKICANLRHSRPLRSIEQQFFLNADSTDDAEFAQISYNKDFFKKLN